MVPFVLLCLNSKQNLLSIKSSNATEISSRFFIMYQWSSDVSFSHISYPPPRPPLPYLHVSQVFELTTKKRHIKVGFFFLFAIPGNSIHVPRPV